MIPQQPHQLTRGRSSPCSNRYTVFELLSNRTLNKYDFSNQKLTRDDVKLIAEHILVSNGTFWLRELVMTNCQLISQDFLVLVRALQECVKKRAWIPSFTVEYNALDDSCLSQLLLVVCEDKIKYECWQGNSFTAKGMSEFQRLLQQRNRGTSQQQWQDEWAQFNKYCRSLSVATLAPTTPPKMTTAATTTVTTNSNTNTSESNQSNSDNNKHNSHNNNQKKTDNNYSNNHNNNCNSIPQPPQPVICAQSENHQSCSTTATTARVKQEKRNNHSHHNNQNNNNQTSLGEQHNNVRVTPYPIVSATARTAPRAPSSSSSSFSRSRAYSPLPDHPDLVAVHARYDQLATRKFNLRLRLRSAFQQVLPASSNNNNQKHFSKYSNEEWLRKECVSCILTIWQNLGEQSEEQATQAVNNQLASLASSSSCSSVIHDLSREVLISGMDHDVARFSPAIRRYIPSGVFELLASTAPAICESEMITFLAIECGNLLFQLNFERALASSSPSFRF